MERKSLAQLFFKGETTKRIYGVLATGVGFVNSYLTITYLTVFDFGLIQLLLAFINILESLNLDVFDTVVTVNMRRYLNQGKAGFMKRLFRESATLKIGIAVIMAAIVFGGSEIIANFYGRDVALFIRIISILLIARTIFNVEVGFLKAAMNFSYWSFPAIREVSKLLIIAWALLFYYLNTLTVIIAYVAAELLAVGLITAFVFIKIYRRNVGSVRAAAEPLLWNLFKTHGKWVTARYAFSRITKNTMPWFVKLFTNTEGVAYYSLAINIVAFIEKLMPMAGISSILLIKAGKPKEIAFIFKHAFKYLFWLGVIFMIIGLLILPPLVSMIFPKYGPALPILSVMLLAFPLYGVYKVLKSTLEILQEYKIMALRILREVLVIPIGAAVFLPLLGLPGAGVVYNLIYWERAPYFYKKLTEKHPDFKLKFSELFKFNKTDYELFHKLWKTAKQSL